MENKLVGDIVVVLCCLVAVAATIWGYRLENGKGKDKEDLNKEDRMEQ